MSGTAKYQVGHEFPNGKRLTKYVGSHSKWRTSLWMWECIECGKEHGPSLTSSITRVKKPACCFQARTKANGNWKGHEDISGSYFNSLKYGAEKRGFRFDVTPEYLWKIWLMQDGKCAYTKEPLTHGKDASLDRIDNNYGYIQANIQWVHKDVNRMKSNFPELRFLELCREIAKHS